MPTCEFCRSRFTNDKGLTSHRARCKGQESLLQESFAKRRQTKDLLKSKAGKRARVEGGVSPELLAVQDVAESEVNILPTTNTEITFAVADGHGRQRRLPGRFNNFVVSSRTPLLPPPPQAPPSVSRTTGTIEDTASTPERPDPFLLRTFSTAANSLGLSRSYPSLPSSNPDDDPEVQSLLSESLRICEENLSTISMSTFSGFTDRILGPFDTFSHFAMVRWHCLGPPTKSESGSNDLINNVLLHPLFDKNDFQGVFNIQTELKKLDRYGQRNTYDTFDSSWIESSVYVKLPSENKHQLFKNEDSAPRLRVDNVYHRKLLPLIKDVLTNASSKSFHYTPFRSYWSPPSGGDTERVFDEGYTSDVWLEAHEELHKKFNRIPCSLYEIAILGLGFSSDGTHLAQFGSASLWPVYLFFLNESKYIRSKPSMHRCHHLAYLPHLPPDFQDSYAKEFGYMASQDVITHCKRELIQEIWKKILDDEFMMAAEDGIIMTCADGITRRIFPRPFTYSADYPKKVSLTCVRSMGLCSCVRCTIAKADFIKTATVHDINARTKIARVDNDDLKKKVEKARQFIYEKGKKIHSEEVEIQLKQLSLTPTRNAFSDHFSKLGINYYDMFVPDFMHEVELGIWKSLFIHLLRLLYAIGGDGIQILNKRYRDVATFGNGTIRRFNDNASALKKLAARDYEDLLQCSIPVFDSLFPPPHDKYVSELLYAMATWHTLAKLRQHTNSTLDHLRATTSDLWQRLRQFLRTTCTVYLTKELPKEEAARGRRKAALTSKKLTENSLNKSAQKSGSTRKEKLLNVLTYKFHSSADYVESIRRYGTTDSYSTQIGELEHKRLKRWYLRTNKTNAPAQIAIREQRERTLKAIGQNLTEFLKSQHPALLTNSIVGGNKCSSSRPCDSLSNHHSISKRKYSAINLTAWLEENENDLAFENFLPRLQDHILMRLLNQYDPDIQYTNSQRSKIIILKDAVYSHKTIRINYTTYDGCRGQDCLSVRKQSDVMVLSREDESSHDQSPYWYARIVGIFHVNVLHTGNLASTNQPQSLEIVWVRWFGADPGFRSGFKEHRLPRIGFVPYGSADPYGFIDPDDIIRGVHLIPAFAYGYTDGLLPQDTVSSTRPTLKRRHDNSDNFNVDWVNYYVNIFVDRDMFMRFRGGGIAHRADQVAQFGADTEVDELDDIDDEILDGFVQQLQFDNDDDDDVDEALQRDYASDNSDSDEELNDNDSDGSDEDEDGDGESARMLNEVVDLGFDVL